VGLTEVKPHESLPYYRKLYRNFQTRCRAPEALPVELAHNGLPIRVALAILENVDD
jgi:hypothetical protein